MVRKATKIAQRTAPGLETGHTSMITKAIAELAVKTIRPATPTKADFFTNLAIQACNDTELLPPRYAALLDDRGKLQETIQATEPAPARKGRDL